MVKDAFESRRRGLEDGFFAQIDNRLIAKLNAERLAAENREELAGVTGIQAPAVIEALVNLNLTTATVVAISLVPLIQVAWADNHVDAKEAEAVLEAARASGLDASHPAMAVLESWLKRDPGEQLFTTWEQYIKVLQQALSEKDAKDLRDDIVGRARAVAQAAGGFLGIHKISEVEETALKRIEHAFH